MQKNNFFRIVNIILLTAILPTSCTQHYVTRRSKPENIYSLTPKSESVKWIGGKEYSINDGNLASITMGFTDQFQELYDQYLEFDVIITNKSQNQILIDPCNFSCTADSIGHLNYAINPEIRIVEIQNYLDRVAVVNRDDRSIGEKVGWIVIGTIFYLTVGIFILIFNSKNKNDIESDNDDDGKTEKEIKKLRQEQEKRATIDELTELKNKWEHETIRKTTLEPNQTLQGKIYFPIFTKFNSLTIEIPTGEEKMSFQFSK